MYSKATRSLKGQIAVVPGLEPTRAAQHTNNQVCYIQQPAVGYRNFMAQQYK